ncbi:hypothetical protein C8R45DRAFT_941238 [Mycena sanguinolenta]|nr:hypothetical protein C8R45DRAFT_941238 [Mycena sanguinolenta]
MCGVPTVWYRERGYMLTVIQKTQEIPNPNSSVPRIHKVSHLTPQQKILSFSLTMGGKDSKDSAGSNLLALGNSRAGADNHAQSIPASYHHARSPETPHSPPSCFRTAHSSSNTPYDPASESREEELVDMPHPPQMGNKGNYIVSLSRVAAWLGGVAEELGAEVYPGFAGAHLLLFHARRAGWAGQGGEERACWGGVSCMGDFAGGGRTQLVEQAVAIYGLREGKGGADVWDWAEGDGLVSIGLVVCLDYKNPYLSPFRELPKRFFLCGKVLVAAPVELSGGIQASSFFCFFQTNIPAAEASFAALHPSARFAWTV